MEQLIPKEQATETSQNRFSEGLSQIKKLGLQGTLALTTLLGCANPHEKLKLTEAEARVDAETRVVAQKIEEVIRKEGVQCGDGRNETGLTTFGAEGSMAYSVAREIQKIEGVPLTREEIKQFVKNYPDKLIVHTDRHGLGEIVKEIRASQKMKQHFTEANLEEIVKNGLRTPHVQKLLKGSHGEAIIKFLADVGSETKCQGCAQEKTILSEEELDAKGKPEEEKILLAHEILKQHLIEHLNGSPHHEYPVYQGEHEEGGLTVLTKNSNKPLQDGDFVPTLVHTTNGKKHDTFFLHKEVPEYRIEQITRYAARLFPEKKFVEDRGTLINNAVKDHNSRGGRTAKRIAPGAPIFDAVFDDEGHLVEVKPAGKIEAAPPKKEKADH